MEWLRSTLHRIGACRLLGLVLLILVCGTKLLAKPPEWRLANQGDVTTLQLIVQRPDCRPTADFATGQIPYIEGATYLSPYGSPDLPEVAYELPVKDEKGARILSLEYLEAYSQSDITISPALGSQIVGRPRKPRIKGEIYAQDAQYPVERLVLGDPYYVDGGWFQMLYVYPCVYNPVRCELQTALTTELTLEGVRAPLQQTQAIRGFYSDDETGALLVVTPAHYLELLQPLIDWKRERGLKVEVLIYGDPVAGYEHVNTTDALRDYIRTKYQLGIGALKFVLLVGNRTDVPPLRCTGTSGLADSDQRYGQIVGSDAKNEVYVGRFSAYTDEHIRTQVARVLWYERDVRHNERGYLRALCIASNEGEQIGDNNETDVEHTEVMRNLLLESGYAHVTPLYDGKSGELVQPFEVSEAINKRVGVITYVGHGTENRWETSKFSGQEIQQLERNDTHPVIFNTACDNGKMESGSCFAEHWLWAQRGGHPTGAIGICASSDLQYWDAPMRGQDAMLEYFTKKRELPYVVTLGGIISKGINEMLRYYHDTPNSSGRITAETWNIFGDPSVVLRTRTPEVLTVSHPNSVLSTDTSMEIQLLGDDQRTQATLTVTASSGEKSYYTADFIHGKARFLGLRLAPDSKILLTVWGVNKETYRATIACTDDMGMPLRIRNFELKPKTVASPDGFTVGDTWEVWATIRYEGSTPPFANVKAHLGARPSGSLQIADGTLTFPVFTATDQEETMHLGDITINEALSNYSRIALQLRLTQNEVELLNQELSLIVSAPVMRITELVPTATLLADGGATLPVRIRLENIGQANFAAGELRLYWKGSNTSPSVTTITPLDAGSKQDYESSIVLPSPLAPFQQASLCAEVWKADRKLTEATLLVLGDQLITPNVIYNARYPFADRAPDLQETFYYFGKPQDPKNSRQLVAVQIPILHTGAELQVRELYADILPFSALNNIPTDKIEPVPHSFSGYLPVENGRVTVPIELFSYDYPMDELVLRIQSRGFSEQVDYFVPAQREDRVRTISRRQSADGKLDSVVAQALPALFFVEASKEDFTFVVRDGQGNPIPEAELTVATERCVTDAQGKTTVNLLEGDYTVSVFSSDHGLQHFPVYLFRTQKEYLLILQEASILTVNCRILNELGQPIEGVHITTSGEEFRTDKTGIARIAIQSGLRSFFLFKNGYRGGARKARVESAETAIEFVMQSLSEPESFSIQIAPNPAQKDLHIASKSLLREIRLYNIDGRLVSAMPVYGYEYRLELGKLPRGTYVLEALGATPKQVARQCFIKDR